MNQVFSNSPSGHALWALYEELAPTLEAPALPKHNPSDIDNWTDSEILQSQEPNKRSNLISRSRVRRLTPTTMFKYLPPQSPELATIQLIAENTSIPIPHVHRTVGKSYTMEYISGTPLCTLWPKLSFPERLKVAFTIRSYILQLRSIRHPRSSIPGPLAEGTTATKSRTPIWGAIRGPRGPFASYAALSAFFNESVVVGVHERKKDRIAFREMGLRVPAGDPPAMYADIPFDDSEPLVFCHLDIHPGNFVVGEDGVVWMLGWGMAGFYPRWFEFVAAGIQLRGMKWDLRNGKSRRSKKDWEGLIPLMCGWYHGHDAWYREMARSFSFR